MKALQSPLIVGGVVVAVIAAGYVVVRGGLAALAPSADSQGSVAGAAGPRGGLPTGPDQRGGRANPQPYVMRLIRLVEGIGRIDGDPKTALTPSQAKAALAILRLLQSHASLDEIGAKNALRALQAVLTEAQRTAIGKLPARQPPVGGAMAGAAPVWLPAGFGANGPPPGFGPGGPPPGNAPGAMKNFNPLRAPVGAESSGRPGGPRLDQVLESLAKKSGINRK